MKLILKFFKKLPLFLNNAFNVSGNKNTNSPEPRKYSLLQKKREKIMESLSFEKRSPQSYELQRKLALLVSNINKIDKQDIEDLEHSRYQNSKEDDLFSYRIDFRNRDDLEFFKEKYKDDLL